MSLSLHEERLTCLTNVEMLLELGSNPELYRCDFLCLVKPSNIYVLELLLTKIHYLQILLVLLLVDKCIPFK